MIDLSYANGVIAVRETGLLKDKIYRLAECGREEGFRMLMESGFGGGTETDDIETLLKEETCALDRFIAEYAPSEAEKEYLLTPRDFHNAKALVKAEYLQKPADAMLAPEGKIPVAELAERIRDGRLGFNEELDGALKEAGRLLKEDASGADVGAVFERALSARLIRVCRRNKTLKVLLVRKADMTNLLTAFRSPDRETAEKMYFAGGTLQNEELSLIFRDEEKAARVFSETPYREFYRLLSAAKANGRPYTEAEKRLSALEADFFYEKRFETSGAFRFLYYVFQRRSEAENVRTIFLCRAAGLSETEIKARLRLTGGGQ